MKALFWLSLGIILYTYIGYPILLYGLGRLRSRRVKRGEARPRVSIIIAAYNEEATIADKLANTLALSYPEELREIIVVSDGSTDRTEEIVSGFAPSGVRCLKLAERSGKSTALNEGVKAAQGEVLVFSDAGTAADPDCLFELLAGFADPHVGCISTEDCVTGGSGEGAYVKYEMLLRKLESRVGSCVAVSGSFYAIRRKLCPHFPPHAATDLLSVMETVRRGYRAVSEPRALARMGTVKTSADEFGRKVRTVQTGLGCLPQMAPLLNPLRYGLFSLELFSHKILRWTGGAFLPPLLASNLMLAGESRLYLFALCLQAAGYLLAGLGILYERLPARLLVVRMPCFFLSTNLSALLACWYHLKGERVAIWQPSRRTTEGIGT